MIKDEREVAQKAMVAYQSCDSFKANQTVTAGQIYVQAAVTFKKPRKVELEYSSYQDPVFELEEKLTGGPEFTTQDLITMRIIYDGKNTWFHHRQSDLTIKRLGKVVPSPLGRTEVMAQIGFLSNLTADFLLRDEDEGTVNGREVRRLGLKPKARRRSLFLKEEIFELERATLALDTETWFPVKITTYSSFPESQITVEYQDVKMNGIKDANFDFQPPGEAKVFKEKVLKFENLKQKLPFQIKTSRIGAGGEYELSSDKIHVIMSEDGKRAYTTLNFYQTPGDKNRGGYGLTLPHGYELKVGNYLSKNMNRRQAFLAENGERINLRDIKATLANRGEKVKDHLPHIDQLHIYEIGWQKEEVFYFLLGQGIDREELVCIAGNIAG